MDTIEPKINVGYVGDATVVTFSEEKILNEQDIRDLQERIMSVVEQTRQIRLILDFRNVRFLSSAVLGMLIRISKKVYESDGQFRLCNIDPKIYEVFKITRLNKIFDIYTDLDSALEVFS